MLTETEIEKLGYQIGQAAMQILKGTVSGGTQAVVAPGGNLGGVMVGFGKYRGKRLHEIKREDLESYLVYLESRAAQEGKALSGGALDLVTKGRQYLGQSK